MQRFANKKVSSGREAAVPVSHLMKLVIESPFAMKQSHNESGIIPRRFFNGISKMKQTLSILCAVSTCFIIGCANEPVAPADGAAVVAAVQQEQGEGGISEKIGNMVEQAKSKAPSMDDMKSMFNKAGDATGQSADDAMKWANKMFQSLKGQGVTTTDNVTDWISEDWNNINAWEYQVISVESTQAATLQEKLNEVGKQRWECFHVSNGDAATTFYMKRQKKSYMKSLPLKDMLKLIPLLDNE